jgi:hypothetical protein
VQSDGELDELVERYVRRCRAGGQAGFDFVGREALPRLPAPRAAERVDRPAATAAEPRGRTAFLRAVVAGIRERAPRLSVAVAPVGVRTGCPHTAGAGGPGVPEVDVRTGTRFGR